MAGSNLRDLSMVTLRATFLEVYFDASFGLWDYIFTSIVVAAVVLALVVLAVRIAGRDQSINHA
jgi:hypothetical protein